MNPNPGGDLEIFAKKINGKATLEELTERVCEAHKAAKGRRLTRWPPSSRPVKP
jgi:hypothetical protein